jgi:hypothetical protein
MSVLFIGPDETDQIEAAVAAARARPTPWEVLQQVGQPIPDHLKLEDRHAGVEDARRAYPSHHVMLGTYHCAISFEYQRERLFRHLSVSSANPNMVPGEAVIDMVSRAFGFSGWPPSRPYNVWVEEYEPGRNAVNLVELADPE